MLVEADEGAVRRRPPFLFVSQAILCDDFARDAAGGEVGETHGFADRAVGADEFREDLLVPAAGLFGFGEDSFGFFAQAFDEAFGGVGAEEVEEAHGEGQGGGVDCGEFDRHDEARDHFGLELFGLAVGFGDLDVPGDVVVWDFEF